MSNFIIITYVSQALSPHKHSSTEFLGEKSAAIKDACHSLCTAKCKHVSQCHCSGCKKPKTMGRWFWSFHRVTIGWFGKVERQSRFWFYYVILWLSVFGEIMIDRTDPLILTLIKNHSVGSIVMLNGIWWNTCVYRINIWQEMYVNSVHRWSLQACDAFWDWPATLVESRTLMMYIELHDSSIECLLPATCQSGFLT